MTREFWIRHCKRSCDVVRGSRFGDTRDEMCELGTGPTAGRCEARSHRMPTIEDKMDYSIFSSGVFVGRIWNPLVKGPCVVTVRDGHVIDITSRKVPTVRDLLELENPTLFVRSSSGRAIGAISDILSSKSNRSLEEAHLLAPCDLQAIKACGVTFARSMIERVIEERAAGNPDRAAAIRKKVAAAIGESLHNLKAGSDEAAKVREVLIKEGGLVSVPRSRNRPRRRGFHKVSGDVIGGAWGKRWSAPHFELVES